MPCFYICSVYIYLTDTCTHVYTAIYPYPYPIIIPLVDDLVEIKWRTPDLKILQADKTVEVMQTYAKYSLFHEHT